VILRTNVRSFKSPVSGVRQLQQEILTVLGKQRKGDGSRRFRERVGDEVRGAGGGLRSVG